jgi:hypothetical protein
VVIKFRYKSVGVYSPPRLRELRMLRNFLLIAQPPLLEEEGKVDYGMKKHEPQRGERIFRRAAASGFRVN